METTTVIDWKGEIGDVAIALRGEGLSASEIAARLYARFHIDVSRNAVLGHIHRSGLCSKRVVTGSAGGKARMFKQRQRRNRALRLPLEAAPMPRADDLARITFADLEDKHCRWIVGDPAQLRGEKMFCGLDRHPGSSYCAGHAARSMSNVIECASSPVGTPVERESEFA